MPDEIHLSETLSNLKADSVENLNKFLHKVYAENVGVEFEHIQSAEERQWLYNRLESIYTQELSKSEKLNMHYLLLMSEVRNFFIAFEAYTI